MAKDLGNQDIYDQRFLQNLFDEMQGSYERVSNICSFGFNRRWRKQLIKLMKIEGGHVCDFMTGTGEAWIYLLPKIGANGRLTAIDFSNQMVAGAERRKQKYGYKNINILDEDVLANSLSEESLDIIVCSYGVKTLSKMNQIQFAEQVKRVLKPGGICGLVEISIPSFNLLQWTYFAYLKYVVPIIGQIFLGNHENYRMLSTYLAYFKNCTALKETFLNHGFHVESHSFFFGCATGLIAKKPLVVKKMLSVP